MLKTLIPPLFLKLVKNNNAWSGNYKTWQEAQSATTGYDSTEILHKVKNSLLKVKKGEAVYERDSVLFDKIQYSWPLLAGLMLAAYPRLSVLDFGGSLGSTYFQNKKFLAELNLKNVLWGIVEQEQFVEIGKKEFEDNQLHFYPNIDDCINEIQPNVLLLSSVLQYLDAPYELLDDVLKYDFDYILIDRTSFGTNHKDSIKIQTVPEEIYKASYPCWFFNEDKFLHYFIKQGYELIEDFSGSDHGGKDYYFKGMIWRKNAS